MDLIAFRDAAEPARSFNIERGDAGALLDAIRALPLDGGSSYGAIDFAQAAQAQRVLVIGDGLSNFGDAEPRAMPASGNAIVHVLHAAQKLDAARLDAIARRGGGVRIDLMHSSADEAASALGRRPWRVLALDAGRAACVDVTPAVPSTVERSLLIAGSSS